MPTHYALYSIIQAFIKAMVIAVFLLVVSPTSGVEPTTATNPTSYDCIPGAEIDDGL